METGATPILRAWPHAQSAHFFWHGEKRLDCLATFFEYQVKFMGGDDQKRFSTTTQRRNRVKAAAELSCFHPFKHLTPFAITAGSTLPTNK
jgi:hypothetical protein